MGGGAAAAPPDDAATLDRDRALMGEQLMELLVVANQYALEPLVAILEGELVGALDAANAPVLLEFADTFGLRSLRAAALARALRDHAAFSRAARELHAGECCCFGIIFNLIARPKCRRCVVATGQQA